MDYRQYESYGESDELDYESIEGTDTEGTEVLLSAKSKQSEEESYDEDEAHSQNRYSVQPAIPASTRISPGTEQVSRVTVTTAIATGTQLISEATETSQATVPTESIRILPSVTKQPFRRRMKKTSQATPAAPAPSDAGETSVHVSRLDIKEPDLAREIAEFVLEELDTDVEEFLAKYPPGTKRLHKKSVSSISITSQTQDTERLYVNEPSTMDLSYEKFENELQFEPLPAIAEEGGADETTQVHLHRSHKRFGRGPRPTFQDGEAQTLEMTLLSKGEAERAFRHMYPLPDDYKPPKIPSRQASLQQQLNAAEQAPKDVDSVKVGPKVKWNKKPRVLPPLPQDYHKEESFWTGSTFQGKYINREFGHGRFNYPLMSTYESEFHNGRIETKRHLGIVTYPRGDKFEGKWQRGRHLAGRITFCDGLEFSPHRWNYCTPPDRRLYIERDVGVKQAGQTLYNDHLPPPPIPPGCYDTGDGIYDPDTGVVRAFTTGEVIREPDAVEVKWILGHCRKSKTVQERYTPCFNIDRLPCSYTENYH